MGGSKLGMVEAQMFFVFFAKVLNLQVTELAFIHHRLEGTLICYEGSLLLISRSVSLPFPDTFIWNPMSHLFDGSGTFQSFS